MAFAADVAIFIDVVATSRDNFGVKGHVSVGESDGIEGELHVAFAPEVAGIFGGLEVADEIASAREGLLSKFSHGVKVTEDGISNGYGGGGEVWFVEGALQKGTGGQDGFSRAGTQGQSKKGYRKDYVTAGLHTAPRSHALKFLPPFQNNCVEPAPIEWS